MSPVEAAAPAIAQQDEAAARDKKVGELRQAAKSSKALPLAQRALAPRESARVFDSNAVPTPFCVSSNERATATKAPLKGSAIHLRRK
jgi:hypothetical protein